MTTRCGFIAILGAPNAGKSTLLNKLVGQKLAIVTPKVQTTRTRILGICMRGDSQLLFVDTPGIFTPRKRIEKAMVEAALQGGKDADAILLLVDAAKGLDEEVSKILEQLIIIHKPKYLALNKIDKVNKPDLLKLTAEFNQRHSFSETFMISAVKGDGISQLAEVLARTVPEGPHLYPPDQLTDMPERQIAAEITREKLFLFLRQELPYSATVETESWEVKEDKSINIRQVITVMKEKQKKIVLGSKGAMLKRIGTAARQEMEKTFGIRAHLFLFVKVREDWQDTPEFYTNSGLNFPK